MRLGTVFETLLYLHKGLLIQVSINYLLDKLTTLLEKWAVKQAELNNAGPSGVVAIKKEIYIIEKDIKAVIDAMGNAVSLEMFNSLWMVVSNNELPSEIRYSAIVALKHLVPWRTADVRDNLLITGNCFL